MGWMLGRLYVPAMAVVGAGLLLLGLIDRRDGLVIGGCVLSGSAAIAGTRRRVV